MGAVSTPNGDATYTITFNNRMSVFTGSAAGLPMGSAHRERPTIHEKEQQVYEIDVPKGTTMLMARVTHPSDPHADLDLYLYDCTGKTCKGAKADADPVGDESIALRNPTPGKWKIVVDGFLVPGRSTAYDYVDVVFNPLYGSVDVIDAPDKHDAGAVWNVKAHAWIADPTPRGRTPLPAFVLNEQTALDAVAQRVTVIDLFTGRVIAAVGARE
jgi:hypothetical protein